jgi:hypothetical protein
VSLPQVDVPGEASSARQNQVIRLIDLDSAHPVNTLAAGSMGNIIMASHNSNPATRGGRHHVQKEVRFKHSTRFEQVLVSRITLKDVGPAIRIEDEFMVECGSFCPRHAWNQAFTSSAVTGDLMVSGFPGQNDSVGLVHLPVDPNLVAPACPAQLHEIFPVVAIMIMERNPARHILTHDAAPLFRSLLPVKAQREDDENGMPQAFISSMRTGRKTSLYTSRVMSFTTTATHSPGRRTLHNGGVPMGLISAARTADAGSSNGPIDWGSNVLHLRSEAREMTRTS